MFLIKTFELAIEYTTQIVAHRLGEYHGVEVEVEALQGGGYLGVVRLGKGEHILLVLVFEQQLHKAVEVTVGKENFAFAIGDIFLQIECNCLSDTEILHCGRDIGATLLGNAEETVDSRTAGENDSRMLQNLNALASKLFERDALNLDEGLKIYTHSVLLSNLVKWGFLGYCGCRLRH